MIAVDVERRRLVRRNTILLAFAQGFVQMSFPVLLIVGGVAAADLSGRDGMSGVVWALYFVSAAVGARVIGRAMDRVGRRPGLVVSYLLVAGAGIGCALSIASDSVLGLLASAVPFGLAVGGANLARGAVADMHPPEERGRAVGYLLAASTVGAVGSPFLVALLQHLAEGRWDPQVLPWIIVPIAGLTATTFVLAVRPDPRDLAVAPDAQADVLEARSPRTLLRDGRIRAAVFAAAVGQMAMVAVMGVTPVALHNHGSSGTAISSVISVHVLGMFAFAPVIGAALDRFGRRPGLIGGGVASIVGALVAGLGSGDTVVGLGLFAIGLGWSATYLGATAVISDLTRPTERAGALGFTDLLISLSSATAGLAGGFVFEGAGFRVLGLAVATLVLAVVLALVRMREPTPVAVVVEEAR